MSICQAARRGSLRLLMVVGSMAVVGCDRAPRPQAPAIRNSPVFQSPSGGFRFLVPERWRQSANASIPPGPIDRPLMLTRYQVATTSKGASLEVLVMDSDDTTDFLEYHRGPSFGIREWAVEESPSSVTIDGADGTQMFLSGQLQGIHLGKEIVVFQRGNRSFHFIGLFSKKDLNARQQIRRAIESLVWKQL